MPLVQEVAEAQRHEALLTSGDTDQLGAPVFSLGERIEPKLQVGVIPVWDVLRNHRQIARVHAEVIAHQPSKGRLLARLGLERGPHKLAE